MSINPHRCVIDADGNYVTLVLVKIVSDDEGVPIEVINTFNGKSDYILKDGERLVKATVPLYPQFIKPVWSDILGAFEETATPEEIEEAKTEPDSQTQHQPSESDRLRALEEAMLDLLMGGKSNV